jgi:hypothetical protein
MFKIRNMITIRSEKDLVIVVELLLCCKMTFRSRLCSKSRRNRGHLGSIRGR